MSKIPVYKPTITSLEKEYVNECLESGWISSKGRFVAEFESKFAQFTGIKHAVSVCNGTTALHIALLSLGVGPGDEVILPTLTYIASANAITYTGAKPVFVDCDRHTWQIDPSDIARAITAKTRAIMAVHLYGQACDMSAIREIADRKNLLIIEDCAEAIGTKIGTKHVGGFGDVATFSFYGNKTISTGEGGMVVTNDTTLAERASHLKGQGLAKFREYWHDVIGYNYRMTNICAAIGCAQLERVEVTLGNKMRIAKWYQKMLAGNFTLQGESEYSTHSHWMFSILVNDSRDRDLIREKLANRGVETRPVFYPIHSMPMYANTYRRMPVSDDVSSRGINLPSYDTLEESDIEYISAILLE